MAEADGQSRACRASGRLPLVWISVLTLLLLAAALPVAFMARSTGRGPWLADAMKSPLSIGCMVIVLCCAAALAGLACALWRAGAACRAAGRRRQEGAAILEFALALPIALMLVLVMIQSSLLMGANLCVHHAAYCAARSAVVQIPAGGGESLFEPANVVVDEYASGKYSRIRTAAVLALLPISCGSSDIPAGDAGPLIDGLQEFFARYRSPAPPWLTAQLARRMYYADEPDNTVVQVHPWPLDRPYGESEDIEVRVHHTFYLSVPYAGSLFARLDGRDGVELPLGDGEYGMRIHASCTLTNEGVRDYVDEELPEQ